MNALVVGGVSIAVQLCGVLLAGVLVLVAVAGDADPDTDRAFLSLLVCFTAASFAAAFLSARRAQGTDGLLPLLAMAGPLLFVLVTLGSRAEQLDARHLVPQVALPLLAGGVGVLAAGRTGEQP